MRKSNNNKKPKNTKKQQKLIQMEQESLTIKKINNNLEVVPPNETLYINNINEKIKPDLLRENLYYLFIQFGDVLEINIRKSKKMRGQAFIVYKDINEATRAKISLDNFLFFGSRIRVNYAKKKSDLILKIKGITKINDYQQQQIYISRKRKRIKEYSSEFNEKEKEKENHEVEKNNKLKEKNEVKNINNNKSLSLKEEDIDGECLNENKILFVEGLNDEVNEKLIHYVFDKYKGLKDVRFFKGRGFCFVEYDNEENAGTALLGLNNMKLTDKITMKISYAKKE